MPQAQPMLTVPIEVQVSGDHTPLLAAHAEQRLRSTLHMTDETVRNARIRIVRHPRATHPIVAQANIDLADRFVRAQVVSADAIEAIAAVIDHLRHHLRKVASLRNDSGHRIPPPHGRFPPGSGHRPRSFPNLPAEIVRCKSVLPTHRRADEAAFDMDIMDFDFHLFVESGSGQDSVLHRRSPAEYRLFRLRRAPCVAPPRDLAISVSTQPAPRCNATEAVDRLANSSRSFLFFDDIENRRGAVLYRRHDGHYGLIVPTEPEG